MAAPQGPCCQIRFLIEHHYPGGLKGGIALNWPSGGLPRGLFTGVDGVERMDWLRARDRG
ncbi:MAG: hypothetical protein R6W06_02380 [Prochlorococcaceae cyanobacterium]